MSLSNMLNWILDRKFKLLALASAICLLWMGSNAFQFLSELNFNDAQNGWILVLILVLMPINWGLETLKIYNRAKLDLSFVDSYKTVLKGVALSFFTPLGLGQYLGRLGQQTETNALRLVPLSLMGSLIQTITNVSIGILMGYPIYSLLYSNLLQNNTKSIYLTLFFSVITLLGIIYFLSKKESKFKTLVGSYFPDIHTTIISTQDIISISVYSILRYGVFVIQFALLIRMHTDVNWSEIISAVSLIYLIQSLIILPVSLNGLIRGGLAVFVLNQWMSSNLALGISWTLFWINIGLPAIFGIVILFIESNDKTRTDLNRVEWYQKIK